MLLLFMCCFVFVVVVLELLFCSGICNVLSLLLLF